MRIEYILVHTSLSSIIDVVVKTSNRSIDFGPTWQHNTVAMSDDQFTKLFKYMQQEFRKLHVEMASKADAAQVDRVYNAVDGIAKRLDTDEAEHSALSSQVSRHEGWIKQLAARIGLPLSHE